MKKNQFVCWVFAILLLVGVHGFTQDVTSGLEAYWTFDEGSGLTAGDSSGNNRDATVRNGAPIWVSGKIGGAVEFLGTDDFAVSGWDGISGDAPRSISYWIRTDWIVDASNGIVGWGLSTENGTKWHTRLNNNADNGTVAAIRTEIQGSFIIGSIPLNDNEWHHIVSVLPDGGFLMEDVIHYVDGEVDEMSGMGNPDVIIDTADFDGGGTEVEIGSRLQGTAQQFYIGLLDDARVYSRELSPEDVRALFELGATEVNEWELY